MTAPLGSTPHSRSHSQLPASQTAPVAEFRCLYTPDVRKKQKKWHDGFLKFHAFNNRVMVYDQARNFLGDTYYKDSNELHEGDELTLDKGVMVEVADAIGVTQTDLTPLFEKKPPAPPPRFQPPSHVARPHPAPSSNTARATAQQLRHKSLNTLLGTPKGPVGKSLPIQSPYEARQEKEKEREKENDFVVNRAAKRQKTAHRSTSPATLRLSSPADRRPLKAPVVTLDDLDAVAQLSSDAPLPSTPPQTTTTGRPAVLHTLRIPRGKVPVPSVKALETPKAPAPASSPPVSASNRLTNVDFAMQPTPAKGPVRRPIEQPSSPRPIEPSASPPRPVEQSASPPRKPKAKSLRLSKGVKRSTLMICQPLPPLKNKQKTAADDGSVVKPARAKRVSPEDAVSNLDQDQEVMHGLMDQTLLIPRTPPPADRPVLVSDSPESVLPKSKATRTARPARDATPQRTNEPVKPRSPPQRPSATRDPMKKQPHPQFVRKPSPPATGMIKAAQAAARAASPALSTVSESRPRTASLSPHKFVALSTGGFRKSVKRATPQPSPAPEAPAPASRNETVALPPHPLRANKRGPVMTTTELAAMLQKPKKKPKAPADPIEQEDDAAGTSPNRKFRRVRSENDAPIPSTSEDWEERNLPKSDTPAAVLAATASVPVSASTTETRETPAAVARKRSGLAALIKRTDPRKKFVRTQSLTVETSLPPPAATESPVVSPTVDKDVGPWSTEAWDLFDWRPPGRDGVET